MTGRQDGTPPAAPEASGPQPAVRPTYRAIDPRAVRAGLGPASSHAGSDPLVIEPPSIPVAPAPRAAGRGILGGLAPSADGEDGSLVEPGSTRPPAPGSGMVLVDGEPRRARLVRRSGARATLEIGEGSDAHRHAVLILEPAEPSSVAQDGVVRREVVVDGWRVEVEIESERRAALRERASQGRTAAIRGGPTEVHAIIPGRIVSVSIEAGDDVVAGQQLLVVEAMKMQNELRAPRDGRIEQVAVAPGETIEVGDLLLVID